MQVHPDRPHNLNSKTANEEMQEVNKAYTILGDELKRREYDMQQQYQGNGMFSFSGGGPGHGNGNGFPPGFPPGFAPGFAPQFFSADLNIDPADILKFFTTIPQAFPTGQGSFYNMDSIRSNLTKPLPIVKTEEIPLSKAYTGCNIPIEVTRWVVENDVKREETETVYLTVPKGVDNNEILIVRDKGNVLNNSVKGDVKVFIKVLNDSDFVRNGLDLFLHKRISLKEALCGFSFDMKYVDGRVFKITNGSGNIVSNNYNKVLHGMGMKREEHVGQLTINFTVAFPDKLTEDQVEHLKNVLI